MGDQLLFPFVQMFDWSPVGVPCPVCQSKVMEPCHTSKGLITQSMFHEPRTILARHEAIRPAFNPSHHVSCSTCGAGKYMPCVQKTELKAEMNTSTTVYKYAHQCWARRDLWMEWIRPALRIPCSCGAAAGQRCGDKAEDKEVHFDRMAQAGLFSPGARPAP